MSRVIAKFPALARRSMTRVRAIACASPAQDRQAVGLRNGIRCAFRTEDCSRPLDKCWKNDVSQISSLLPGRFREVRQPGYVEMVWTLRADPVGSRDAPMSTDSTATDRLSTASEVAKGILKGHLSARDVVCVAIESEGDPFNSGGCQGLNRAGSVFRFNDDVPGCSKRLHNRPPDEPSEGPRDVHSSSLTGHGWW